jgi:hypothetical protein
MAIVAFVVAVVGGPVAFILTLIAVGLQASEGETAGSVVLCVVAVSLPGVALALGWLALREIESKPNVAGRALAASGAVVSLTGLVYASTLALVLIAKQRLG